MSLLMTFPGQGTQRPGMISGLPRHDAVDRALDEVHAALGYSPFRFDALDDTSTNGEVQLAMTIVGHVQSRLLRSFGIEPDYVLGLSIGAFGAALCSGLFSLKDGLDIVHHRGQLMSQAYPEGYGMAAIIGLPTREVEHLVTLAQARGLAVHVGNINSDNTTIVSGSFDGLDHLCAQAIGHHAHSAQRLNVSVPSHCQLLAPQAEELHRMMRTIPLNRPRSAYVSANRARVLRDVEDIRKDLAFNMCRTVHLSETLAMMSQRGITLAVEASPGTVLTRLCHAAMPATPCLSMETTALDHLLEWVVRT